MLKTETAGQRGALTVGLFAMKYCVDV
jgi:hypothetical protein